MDFAFIWAICIIFFTSWPIPLTPKSKDENVQLISQSGVLELNSAPRVNLDVFFELSLVG